MKNARGNRENKAYGEGKKLSLKQSILAKCADCTCNYADGKVDCGVVGCPLYPFMVYGPVWMGRERKIVSKQHLETMRKNIKRGNFRDGRDRDQGTGQV